MPDVLILNLKGLKIAGAVISCVALIWARSDFASGSSKFLA